MESKVCGVWETRRRIETAILMHNFFSWSYHAVLSSKPHLALFLLGRWKLNRRPAICPWPQWGIQPLAGAPLTDRISSRRKLRLTETHFALISHGDLHISFHNTHTFLFNQVTSSGYFHWCALCRESLIDWLVKGQYAIWLPTPLIWSHQILFRVIPRIPLFEGWLSYPFVGDTVGDMLNLRRHNYRLANTYTVKKKKYWTFSPFKKILR